MDWLIDLERLFQTAVKGLCQEKTAVVFSSGVDSSMVAYAASRFSETTAYIVGVESSEDMRHARAIEGSAPFKIRYVDLTLDDVERLVPRIVSITGSTNPIDVGVGIPFFMASKAASKDGFPSILCGQGGDELFGGYWRYVECLASKGQEATVRMMQEDWSSAHEDNLDRDIAMCRQNNVELGFPFLDKGFSDYALRLPFDLKIRRTTEVPYDEFGGDFFVRKYALKLVAEKFGVPASIVHRTKKAAQYGSGTNKTLDKIARMRGFREIASGENRTDYLKKYLETIMEQLK